MEKEIFDNATDTLKRGGATKIFIMCWDKAWLENTKVENVTGDCVANIISKLFELCAEQIGRKSTYCIFSKVIMEINSRLKSKNKNNEANKGRNK